LEQFLASDLFGRDLTAKRFFGDFSVKLRTVRREQIISNAEWARSVEFNDFVRQGGLDLGILSQQAFRCGERTNAMVLYPALGDVRMTERGRRLVHLAQQELVPVLGTVLAVAGDPGWSNLPPRWRQTLDCLLEGDSEKQVAQRLGISPLTIHEYVKGLYRHFGVSSRSELLAFFLRRYGAARPWKASDPPPPRHESRLLS
jgi:DNA-binding CsgD family transcriptional regulator